MFKEAKGVVVVRFLRKLSLLLRALLLEEQALTPLVRQSMRVGCRVVGVVDLPLGLLQDSMFERIQYTSVLFFTIQLKCADCAS